MKNLGPGWRHSSEDRRDSGKVWRVRNTNHKQEASGLHRHTARRGYHAEGVREERDSGWGYTARANYGPSSTNSPNRRADFKEIETTGDDGWGSAAVDNNTSEDLTSAWEALATTNLSDWSKPPLIESVERWDDAGAKETWDFVQSGRSPANNPDLYVEKNIDWNSRIPPDLLACVDNKSRNRKASPPRSGSPVLLGLEKLVEGWEGAEPLGKVDVERLKFIKSSDKLEQGGGSGSWGEFAKQNAMSGQRRTKQQYNEQESGEKQSNLMGDDYRDRSRKRRGDKDEHHWQPRFRANQRY